MDDVVDIAGLDRAAVLAALYNGSHQLGMGFMHSRGATGMTVEEAARLLEIEQYFDYLHGRVMKIGLPVGATTVRVGLYDRDNGRGAAARVIAALRATGAASLPEAA